MKERILIADDEPPIRETVSSMLSAVNYACRECGSGVDALQILTTDGTFELVLYDLTMKDVDGVTFAHHTKQSFPDTLLVVMASIHDISTALAAIRDGAYDYLLKPFDREQLLNTVSRALENHRLRVENRTYSTNLDSLVRARTEQLQNAMANLERSYDITLETLGNALVSFAKTWSR
jgi:DNA-binding NtrC family response regulator